jgi:pSer/pThr/pTyr-binding forkhead associated (FHA) protein
MSENPSGLAKLTWIHPQTKEQEEFVLSEGATASIGRLAENDICIPEQHVSRRHAVIAYDAEIGGFVIKDPGSANGTFVNDKQIKEPTPLVHGDEIRLYVPTLKFSSVVTEHERTAAAERGTLITAIANTGKGKLIITTGPQEGNTIPLLLEELTVGRATNRANWEIALQDPSVSRPHARLRLENGGEWHIQDLGSANGTLVNGKPVAEDGQVLHDGDIVAFGATLALFRAG